MTWPKHNYTPYSCLPGTAATTTTKSVSTATDKILNTNKFDKNLNNYKLDLQLLKVSWKKDALATVQDLAATLCAATNGKTRTR